MQDRPVSGDCTKWGTPCCSPWTIAALPHRGGSSSGGDVLHRVLIVEDEEPVARALERWLKRRRVEVRVLLDPLGFEVLLTAFNPTHVVSDLVMPERNGLEVLRVARQLMPDAVRVLLSGSLDSVKESALVDLMPVRLVSKPWRDATLAVDLGLEPAP